MGTPNNSKGVENINGYCKTVGIIFLGLGILHIILSGLLSAWWGAMLIILGILVLSYRSKIMIIVVGVALIFVGLLNIFDSIVYEINAYWLIFGVLQIIWGIQELRRYKHTKENIKCIIKKEKKKGFIWYSLRILFVLTIFIFLVELIFPSRIESLSDTLITLLFFIEILIFIGAFVISILHLHRYNKKGLAVACLLLSLIVLLISLSGFFYGMVMGGLSDFNDEQIESMEIYCDNLCLEKNNDSYEYYQISYDEIMEMPICYCLDINEEFLLNEQIPSSEYNKSFIY